MCHQSGIVCFAGDTDKSLVASVYWVVLLFILPHQWLVAASPVERAEGGMKVCGSRSLLESLRGRSIPVWSFLARDFHMAIPYALVDAET